MTERDSLMGDRSNVCAACPTPDRRHGLPCGECPVCGTFWTPTQAHNGTGYGIVGISREDYQRWMQANGHGTTPPALHLLPNVVMQTAPIQDERPPTRLQAFLASKGVPEGSLRENRASATRRTQ